MGKIIVKVEEKIGYVKEKELAKPASLVNVLFIKGTRKRVKPASLTKIGYIA